LKINIFFCLNGKLIFCFHGIDNIIGIWMFSSWRLAIPNQQTLKLQIVYIMSRRRTQHIALHNNYIINLDCKLLVWIFNCSCGRTSKSESRRPQESDSATFDVETNERGRNNVH
jgi:hypothetical protein